MKILKTKYDIDIKTDDVNLFEYLIELINTVVGSYSLEKDERIDQYLGGFIYLIEEEHDLKKIYTSCITKLPKGEQDRDLGGWASIVECPDAFDQCEYILNGEYVAILLCTNNDGGNLFIVPKHIAETEPNIDKSIKMTSIAWTGNEK